LIFPWLESLWGRTDSAHLWFAERTRDFTRKVSELVSLEKLTALVKLYGVSYHGSLRSLELNQFVSCSASPAGHAHILCLTVKR
jgi:hypothetical protein